MAKNGHYFIYALEILLLIVAICGNLCRIPGIHA